MKRDEILSEFKKGVKARKYNRRYIDPDRESETMIAPRTPPKKKDDVKEATGDAVGKITKVDPATKKATISKPDGTTQEIDSTALKPTPDGKMQMDAPDTDEIKTGTDVVSTEDALSPPGDSKSPIHGGEDHDEVSKLLVQRLRKLAGLQEEPAPAAAPATTPAAPATTPAAPATTPAAPATAPAASQVPDDLTVQGMIDNPELSAEEKAYMQKILVSQPNGTLDIARTFRNISGELIQIFPQLADVFKDLQTEINNFIRTPEFSELAPADQTSIINLGKQLPSIIQQIESETMQLAKTHDKEFNKMDAQTGQYGDGQVQEADAGETTGQDIPPMPNISGLQPGQAKDLGNGDKVTMAADGNIHYTGGFGIVVYSPQGKPLSYTLPTIGGLGQKQDFSTGNTTTDYNTGPVRFSHTKNAQGQLTTGSASYNDYGLGATGNNFGVNVDQAYKGGQPTIQTRTGSGAFANMDLVKNQDALDRARRNLPTSEDKQLEAMLRIAGLR